MKRGAHVFTHPDPEMERLANKRYQEDPETQKLVDELLCVATTEGYTKAVVRSDDPAEAIAALKDLRWWDDND